MTAAVITGVIALFNGEWAILVVAVVAFYGIGAIFANANKGVEQITRVNATSGLSSVTAMVESGDWYSALKASNRVVKELSQTVRVGGKQSENRGPLGAALLVQSSLLGVNGDAIESSFAARRAVSLLEGIEDPSPFADELIQIGRHLEIRSDDQAFCARTAMALLS